MAFDLFEEKWIPVLRKSGKVDRIAPKEIVDPDDPPVRVQSSRPDFDAALTEMLIGLVQTAFTPKDNEEWEEVLDEGLEPAELARRLEPFRDVFRLDGDGPRFMQDLTVHQDYQDEKPVVALLMDEGVAADASLFAKTGRYEAFCLPDAAAALMTLQAFAPSGGVGHRTSLRGGGPLSVTLQDELLWRTVWWNVLTRKQLRGIPGNDELKGDEHVFPWLAPTRTSERKGDPGISPDEIHPLQHYWAMPRRVRLNFEGARGSCDICGGTDVEVVRSFFSRNYGANYKGPYLHPLTPYTNKRPNQPPNPTKAGASGISYRDWPLAFLGGEGLIPPKVVEVFIKDRSILSRRPRQLSACGYAMDNMKPLRFVEARLPTIPGGPEKLGALRSDVIGLVEASEEVRRTLVSQVKAAWKDRPKDQSGDVNARVDHAFWDRTSSEFFETVTSLQSAPVRDDVDAAREAKLSFLKALKNAAERTFGDLCPLEADLAPESLARTVRARRDLLKYCSPKSPRLLSLVGIAAERKTSRKAGNAA
ncbi:MAG TPA: type I-E CRISPR-associated protein Cse1/CasA [Vulgatibacter sp.]|nr:type I-E CRISPR-associated protein Cse1/CasA [Vulgatibacter sp.]